MNGPGPDTADIINGNKPLPLWKSKRTTSLWLCGAMVMVSVWSGADKEVQVILAGAFALGFQFFMRGENSVDLKTRELQFALVAPKKEKDGQS